MTAGGQFVAKYIESHVIPSEAKESPGGMLRYAGMSNRAPVPIFGAVVVSSAYQEIATSGFALLAMTAVVGHPALALRIKSPRFRRNGGFVSFLFVLISRADHSDRSGEPNGLI